MFNVQTCVQLGARIDFFFFGKKTHKTIIGSKPQQVVSNSHIIKTDHVKCQHQHRRSDGCERITAEGNRLLKRFVRAVGTIATNGCRIDSALLKDFSEVEIECIANLMQEDKNDVLSLWHQISCGKVCKM